MHPARPATDHNILRGTLDLLILKSLTWGALHGYAISEWIDRATDSTLLVEEGTLYPALHRLEGKGWVAAEWGVSKNNRRAKFYRLTPSGQAHLRSDSANWTRYVDAVAKALAVEPEIA